MIALAFKIGMSYDDFLRLDVDAFTATAILYNEDEEMKRRERWNMMRVQTAFIVRPYLSEAVTPDKLIPLWFDEEENKPSATVISAEQQRERMKQLAKQFGNEI